MVEEPRLVVRPVVIVFGGRCRRVNPFFVAVVGAVLELAVDMLRAIECSNGFLANIGCNNYQDVVESATRRLYPLRSSKFRCTVVMLW